MLDHIESYQQIESRLNSLYPDHRGLISQFQELIQHYTEKMIHSSKDERWTELDVVLITYGDQVKSDDQTPLHAQRQFLIDHDIDKIINTVHFLPFCPYTSDDGFSVVDYLEIDPDLGDWQDVNDYRSHFDLMFDLVLNHCSQSHQWFQQFLKDDAPGNEYFHTHNPDDERLNTVTRPRSTPLLTAFNRTNDTQYVWTTFSDDQVDLNYESPQLLMEMTSILLEYVNHGARIIRLDAIAYLWKELGTSCIHLPETHQVVKLLRDVLDIVAPHVILLTETNVPHQENVSYFGDQDEAHMVYQFSLAPLLLDALLNEDPASLIEWLSQLESPQPGTTYFNFTASHDGVGVRPLEGLVSAERLQVLVEEVKQRGGQISYKRNSDGTDSPYELNITYFSALKSVGEEPDDFGVRRYLCSQAIMISLQGIPGIYFHSLFATENDELGFQETKRARTLNRKKYPKTELESILSSEGYSAEIFRAYQQMLLVRKGQTVFHPDSPQQVVKNLPPGLMGFWRGDESDPDRILVLANVTSSVVSMNDNLIVPEQFQDLLNGQMLDSDELSIDPFQCRWLKKKKNN